MRQVTQYPRWIVHSLLLATLGGGCVHDDQLKIAYNDTPRSRDDGWMVATPESQGMDPAELAHAYERVFSEDDYVTARSLLVVRNGYLVAEGYCRDLGDIDHLGAVQSATKSVTSLAAGIAMDLRLLDSLDCPLAAILPDKFGSDPIKRGITIRHLLTMKSGLDFSNDDFSAEMAHEVPGDGIRHILSKPMIHDPGSVFNYQDCDPHLVSAALHSLTGTPLSDFVNERVFSPIGISDYVWNCHNDGTTYGAYGLYLTSRDMARLGQLMLQNGAWGGQQIISAEWIAASTAWQTEVDDEDVAQGLESYGFYWWRAPEFEAYTALGHGGQYIMVIPSSSLVIVMTSEPSTDGDWVAISGRQFLSLVRIVVDACE